MAFVDDNKIIVLEKNTGLVHLISDGALEKQPVLKLPGDIKGERGLLGIAVFRNNDSGNNNNDSYIHIENKLHSGHAGPGSSPNTTNVFLYFTESNNKSSNIVNNQQFRNTIYKYEWNGQTLANPTLILDLPARPGPYHNGGKLIIGPDHYLYTVIGDLACPKTQSQDDWLADFSVGMYADAIKAGVQPVESA
jgi:glucose/arabinose dehydrogenase